MWRGPIDRTSPMCTCTVTEARSWPLLGGRVSTRPKATGAPDETRRRRIARGTRASRLRLSFDSGGRRATAQVRAWFGGSSTAIARPGEAFIGSFWYHSTRNREADRLRPRVAYEGHMSSRAGRRKEGGRYGRRRGAESTRRAELGRFRPRSRLDLDAIS